MRRRLRPSSKEKRVEVAAVAIMLLWVAAWAVSLTLEKDIPQALNVVMPVAAGALLGVQLPVNGDKKKGTNEPRA